MGRGSALARGAVAAAAAAACIAQAPERLASGSAPASRTRHHTRKRAVIRTVGTTPDPVRYMYVNRSPVPRTAHGHRALPTRDAACRHPPPLVFPQIRRHLRRCPQRPGDARIQPTHSPRDSADGFRNLSFCT